jgi:EpsI family protein
MKQPFRVALSCSVLIGALLFLHFRSTGEAVPVRKPLDTFPIALGNWHGREATIFEIEILNILKVNDYLMRRYVDSAGRSLWLYIAYWETQRKGAQPHSPKNCLPGGGWEPLEATQVTIPLPAPYAPITVNRFLLQKDRAQQLVFYWYGAQGRPIASEMAARIEMVKSALSRNRTDGALIRVSSPVYGSVAGTSELLLRYIQAMYPVLHEYLPE